MEFSKFADKLAMQTGIGLLMDDLCDAMQPGRDVYMLGGGNPSRIPAIQQFFRKSMQRLLDDGADFDQALSDYDPPQGNTAFIESLATLFKERFGWNITSKNIALTNGSQQAFFVLFNMFAGLYRDGSHKKILFPMAPEYIGYCDVGLSDGLFESVVPSIEVQDDLFFKYHINFDKLHLSDSIGAMCVSRPTNPTGNVLTDEEIVKLAKLAKANHIPLIIDNAYGKPFPDIIYTDVNPYWDENAIVCMSLSKLGMPGTRTGIIIAPEEVVHRVTRINAIISLSPGGIGAGMATELVKNGSILEVGEQIIQPFYRQKMEIAIELARKHFADLNIGIHRPEGSFFLWLWFKDLPVSSNQLYQQLKDRGVIVVPGNYFFFGLDGQVHPHQNQCLRINHAQDREVIDAAFGIIAQEAKAIINKNNVH
jgi:valine--pyruvate aminotransferase